MPGVPGIFIPEQLKGWKKVVDAVHAKGGYIYAQLWHAGRATISAMTGSPPVSASATPWDSPDERYPYVPVGATEQVRYVDSPPIELSVPHIKRTIQDYCRAAKNAMEVGFDGVEIHCANGYLPEQFLSSNINKRTDEYGGSPEKRCTFVLELMDELAKTIGEENMAIRLSPFGLFNQARGEQRVETWSHLCRRLKAAHPRISYVSFIEPVCRTDIFWRPRIFKCRKILTRLPPALRTDLHHRGEGRLPALLGPRGRRPQRLPRDHGRHALLLRGRLQRPELLGRPRVRPLRRPALRAVLHQQPGPGAAVEGRASADAVRSEYVLRAVSGSYEGVYGLLDCGAAGRC